MNNWANRFLGLMWSVAFVAIMLVPFEENGASPFSIVAAKLAQDHVRSLR